MHKPLLLFAILFVLFATSCNSDTTVQGSATSANSDSASVTDSYSASISQGNVYEVNVRQYTPEGTFKAFEQHLQRLKDMGVQTLWFMPINPISKKDRKGALGSYYAVSNYTAINPEFGTIEDWKALVKKAHQMVLKLSLIGCLTIQVLIISG